jgi:hypothetical protein
MKKVIAAATSVGEVEVSAKSEFSLIDENMLKSRIYTIRGLKVMLDADLAEIYGYSTKAFNRQVKNNIEKFDEDFRFQLSNSEIEELSRSKNLTLELRNLAKTDDFEKIGNLRCKNCTSSCRVFRQVQIDGELSRNT